MNNSQERTDPALRAALFVSQFRNAAAPPAEKRNERSVRHAIARMYDCENHNISQIIDVISRLWKIPDAIRVSLSHIENLDASAYESTIKEFETLLLDLSLHNDALSVKNKASADLETKLKMISGFLIINDPEALPGDKKIDELLKNITDLEVEIKKANLDARFTDYFLHRLDALRYALNHYDTLGPDEVIRRVNEIFGGLILQAPEIRKSKKMFDIAKKMWSLANVVALLLNLCNGSFDALENYQEFVALDSGISRSDQQAKK